MWGPRGQTDTEEVCRVAARRGAAAGEQGQDTETLPPYPLSYTKFVQGIYVAQFPMKLFPGSWLKLAMQEETFEVRADQTFPKEASDTKTSLSKHRCHVAFKATM